MIEQTVSVQKMLTYTSWVATVLLLVAAPMVAFWADRPWIGVLIAEVACVTSAIAATLTVRCFMSKLAALVRTTAGGEREPMRVHTLR
jgi:hypothetical protein